MAMANGKKNAIIMKGCSAAQIFLPLFADIVIEIVNKLGHLSEPMENWLNLTFVKKYVT